MTDIINMPYHMYINTINLLTVIEFSTKPFKLCFLFKKV